MEPDPADLQYGLNPYAYCENNPVNMVDLTGKNPVMVVSGVIGGVVGFGSTAAVSYITDGKVDWRGSVAAAGVGATAGFFAPITATTYVGAAATNAIAGGAQYLLGTPSNQLTVAGAFYSMSIGAVGGVGAGKSVAAGFGKITGAGLSAAFTAAKADTNALFRTGASAVASGFATSAPAMNGVNNLQSQMMATITQQNQNSSSFLYSPPSGSLTLLGPYSNDSTYITPGFSSQQNINGLVYGVNP